MITADYETFSELDLAKVGAAVYAAHPSTEVLSIAYDLENGQGVHVWLPGLGLPDSLFKTLAAGGLMEAHNSGFEFLIWNLVCCMRYGWPQLKPESVRCSQSKALAYGLPAKLETTAQVLQTRDQKDTEGKRLLNKFSKPRKPTKADPSTRIHPIDDSVDFANLIAYNIQDVNTEKAISAALPDLTPTELEVWQLDQKINQRGLHVDRAGIEACISIVEQAFSKYTKELQTITGGAVTSVGQLAKMTAWLNANGGRVNGLTKDDIPRYLAQPNMPTNCRRVLEIRQKLGSASVKKLYTMLTYAMTDDRIRYILNYYEGHTGRWTSVGPQFHNFPKARIDDVAGALAIIMQRNLDLVEATYGDPLDVIAACLRGLITPSPGAEFICSDYSSIEARVIAYLSGEQWRIDVFEGDGKMYERSAATLSDIPLATILAHKERTGEHHPLRPLGKLAELASGFQGSVGAWVKFGADKHYTADEWGTVEEKIQIDVNKWRGDSPKVVAFWYGLQNVVQDAICYPGREFTRFGLKICVRNGALFITLLSGRDLVYQNPRISSYGKYGDEIIYKGVVKGQWVDISTYGGKLAENIVQATARDILAHGMMNLEKAGYPVVLHVHDEVIAEVKAGTGSIEEFETIMSTMPDWCRKWVIPAGGGWRGPRFKKD